MIQKDNAKVHLLSKIHVRQEARYQRSGFHDTEPGTSAVQTTENPV